MAAPIDIPIPLGLEIAGGYTIRFTAVDATTGALVPGVVVSGATVQYDPEPQPTEPIKSTAFFLPGPSTE